MYHSHDESHDESDDTAATESVDREWLPGWEADRQQMSTSAGGPVARALTASHGLPVLQDSASSPPLQAAHTGPWVVLPIDMHARAADAMLPFQWVARVLHL